MYIDGIAHAWDMTRNTTQIYPSTRETIIQRCKLLIEAPPTKSESSPLEAGEAGDRIRLDLSSIAAHARVRSRSRAFTAAMIRSAAS